MVCDFEKISEPFREKFYEYVRTNYEMKKKHGATLINEYNYFKNYTMVFMQHKTLRSFKGFDAECMREFAAYLSTIITPRKKPLTRGSASHVISYLKSYCGWLARFYPHEAPNLAVFKVNPLIKGVNLHLKTKLIDEIAISSIKSALRTEKDPYIKACLLIALYHGFRSEDIMNLTRSCLIEDSDTPGKFILRYYNQKSAEWFQKRTFLPVVNVIRELAEHTLVLFNASQDDRLFIHKADNPRNSSIKGEIRRYGYQSPNNWLKRFIASHYIYDSSGNLLQCSIHQFRHSLLSSMDAKGVEISIASYVADHKHTVTTMQHYLHTQDTVYNEHMDKLEQISNASTIVKNVGSIPNVSQVSSSPLLRLDSGYCNDLKMAEDDDYICEHFSKRGNCYGCSKMITTPEYLPYFKKLLAERKNELKTMVGYGEHVLRQIRFEIAILKMLIVKLESLEGDHP